MKKGFLQAALIFLLTIVAYAPTINGELLSSDDTNLIESLKNVQSFDLEQLFVRSGSKLLYYRPLTILSYRVDKILFDLNTRAMHLENILLHGFCAWFVFLLTRFLLPPALRCKSYLPLLAGLLFALHPLTVESTSWISGRTDLLAGFFLLSATICLLRYRECPFWGLLALAFVLLLCAFLSKEVAVAFVPGGILLLLIKSEFSSQSSATSSKNFWRKIGWTAALLMPLILFMGARFLGHGSSSRVGRTFQIITNDFYYAIFVCLRGIGFYFKKLFVPWPLNFSILEVDPLYELLGIPVVLLVLWILFRWRLQSVYVFCGALLITPAFLLMFNQIAWTPYAERYLYVPLAFFIPPLVVWLGCLANKHKTFWPKLVVATVLVVFFVSSFERAKVWSTNLSLWEDTVKKSPYSLSARNDYGLALHTAGRIEDSLPYFKYAAESFRGVNYNPNYGINYAIALMDVSQFDEAQKYLEKVLERTKWKNVRAREVLIELHEKRILQAHDTTEAKLLREELEKLLRKI